MENEQQKKNQLIANTLGNVEKLIDETPLSRRDRETFIEGLKAIVDELNKAIEPPKEAPVEPFPHIVEDVACDYVSPDKKKD